MPTFKPPASPRVPAPAPQQGGHETYSSVCTHKPAIGYVPVLGVKDTGENVALKAIQAEQEILAHVGAPSGKVLVHPGGIRSYSISWNFRLQQRWQRLFRRHSTPI